MHASRHPPRSSLLSFSSHHSSPHSCHFSRPSPPSRQLAPRPTPPWASSGFFGDLKGAVRAAMERGDQIRKGLMEGEYVAGGPLFDDEDTVLLHRERTQFNFIQVVEVLRRANSPMAGCRILMLDEPGNVHSMWNRYKLWTNSYYDYFAALPPLLPPGPLGIFGLAAGTGARIVNEVWPWVQIHGWEIDPAVVEVARKHFGIQALEVTDEALEEAAAAAAAAAASEAPTFTPQTFLSDPPPTFRGKLSSSVWGGLDNNEWFSSADEPPPGCLTVHVGDALADEASLDEKFAGIIVDLYARGVVIPQLEDVDVWRSIRGRLREGGRVLVNCGGGCVEGEKSVVEDGETVMIAVLRAMSVAFDSQVLVKRLGGGDGNVMALTGPNPGVERWRAALPAKIRPLTARWQTCDAFLSSLIANRAHQE